MTDSISESIHETADELWADDELSDEALDRAAGQLGKLTNCGTGCGLPDQF